MNGMDVSPGDIVRCRNREWVLLPGDDEDVFLLRSLAGGSSHPTAVHKGVMRRLAAELPTEQVVPAVFPSPPIEPGATKGADAMRLLWRSARLTLRDGAAPLRSLGRISLRPRAYQFTPLLMALRLDPVRMLIADDVGVGKTIEAALIARELYDRREIRRFCVLCPAHLCEQWRRELDEKFNFQAVIIAPGTVSRLEMGLPPGESLYLHHPFQVASIDFLKSDRNRNRFPAECPDLVIVDEAHNAAADKDDQNRQQRRRFLREIADDPTRHLILLTATPHSGVPDAFQSLLSLLENDFSNWDFENLDEQKRRKLALHFVQRTRHDIIKDWGEQNCFPQKRTYLDVNHALSGEYRDLFDKAYNFCLELVDEDRKTAARSRRARYWGALALLRCVMSSPAAAAAALRARRSLPPGFFNSPESAPDDFDMRRFILDLPDSLNDDDEPTPTLAELAENLSPPQSAKLDELQRRAEALFHSAADNKLADCFKLVADQLRSGAHPIVWCRYVATAEYVAEAFRQRFADFSPQPQVLCLTGRVPEEERRRRLAELSAAAPRILVATDCLSEGLNLQDFFTATLHYDLPWNPNRLEQREGRVDRYGQSASSVTTIRYFSLDNPIDAVVIDVLIRKADHIHRTLGTHVSAPEKSDDVMEAVMRALFLRRLSVEGGGEARQMKLVFSSAADSVRAACADLHKAWEHAYDRERVNRTRYAQRDLNPEVVLHELAAADAVLGDADEVRAFVCSAVERYAPRGRLHIQATTRPDVFHIATAGNGRFAEPEMEDSAIAVARASAVKGVWAVTFTSPPPPGVEFLSRHHPFVAALARSLFEESLRSPTEAAASRCAVMKTRAVKLLTRLFLLRVRHLLRLPERAPLLSEEALIIGEEQTGDGNFVVIPPSEATALFAAAQPDANLTPEEKLPYLSAAVADWPGRQSCFLPYLTERAAALSESHRRVRRSARLRIADLQVTPCLPPDFLGVFVLVPVSA